jgi:hypothetical protein
MVHMPQWDKYKKLSGPGHLFVNVLSKSKYKGVQERVTLVVISPESLMSETVYTLKAER